MFNGDRLKFARTYRGMSAQELAEKINVSRQSINQFENYNKITAIEINAVSN